MAAARPLGHMEAPFALPLLCPYGGCAAGGAHASPRTGGGGAGASSPSVPPLCPLTHRAPSPAGKQRWLRQEKGQGAAGCSAKNNPLLIKRWSPGRGAALPAPYKYARCAARGLWPARLCRRRGAAERSERSGAATAAAAAARSARAPAPRHPSKMPRVDADLKLDFKDVLLRPKRSSLKSRSEVGAFKPSMLSLRSQRLTSSTLLPSLLYFYSPV